KQIGEIRAGAGGTGAPGGSITNIVIAADVDGMTMVAGAGGAADAGVGRFNGGAGGAIKTIFIAGLTDLTAQDIILAGGAGGDAPGGIAGKGGAASNIFLGFTKSGPSGESLHDNAFVSGGKGGNGKIAGP